MSRLNSFIRRVTAQRDCLDHAAELVAGDSGTILELGLGNGRTYDHLRSLFLADEIYVFDRHIKAHPDCIPDDEHMILGDFLDTLPNALSHIGSKARMAHCDIGTGDKAQSVKLAADLAKHLSSLLKVGGVVVSDQPFNVETWTPLPLPKGVSEGRYHMYRV